MILRETFFVCICYYKKFIVFFEITTTRRLLLLIFRLGNQKTDTARSRNTKFLTSRRTIAITSGRFVFNHRRERYFLDDPLCLVEKSQVRGAPTLARASHHPPVARITQDKRF